MTEPKITQCAPDEAIGYRKDDKRLTNWQKHDLEEIDRNVDERRRHEEFEAMSRETYTPFTPIKGIDR